MTKNVTGGQQGYKTAEPTVSSKLITTVLYNKKVTTISYYNVFPQLLQPAADTDWGPLAQRPTFCQELEQDLVNVASSTPVQPPGTLWRHSDVRKQLHDITDTSTFRKRLKNVLFDRAFNWFCWRSWTCRLAVPYKFCVDWLSIWMNEWMKVRWFKVRSKTD